MVSRLDDWRCQFCPAWLCGSTGVNIGPRTKTARCLPLSASRTAGGQGQLEPRCRCRPQSTARVRVKKRPVAPAMSLGGGEGRDVANRESGLVYTGRQASRRAMLELARQDASRSRGKNLEVGELQQKYGFAAADGCSAGMLGTTRAHDRCSKLCFLAGCLALPGTTANNGSLSCRTEVFHWLFGPQVAPFTSCRR